MEVRIGVVHTPKELTIETEGDGDAVIASIEPYYRALTEFLDRLRPDHPRPDHPLL